MPRIQKLLTHLESYKQELKNYEKDALANGKSIDVEAQNMLGSIREMMEEITLKLEPSAATTNSAAAIEVPICFQKDYIQVQIAAEKLEKKLIQAQKTKRLDIEKEKLCAQLATLTQQLPTLESSFVHSNSLTQAVCIAQVDTLKTQLSHIKSLLHSVEPLI